MTQAFKPKSEVKTIGSGGQIYLSKKLAGQHVVVTQEREGVWTVKTADVVPHDERWLYVPGVQETIVRSLEWMDQNPPQAVTLEEIDAMIAKLENS